MNLAAILAAHHQRALERVAAKIITADEIPDTTDPSPSLSSPHETDLSSLDSTGPSLSAFKNVETVEFQNPEPQNVKPAGKLPAFTILTDAQQPERKKVSFEIPEVRAEAQKSTKQSKPIEPLQPKDSNVAVALSSDVSRLLKREVVQQTSLVGFEEHGPTPNEQVENHKENHIINHEQNEEEDLDENDQKLSTLLSYVSLQHKVMATSSVSAATKAQFDEYKTAPLFSRAVDSFLRSPKSSSAASSSLFRQYGLLGVYESTGDQEMNDSMVRNDPESSRKRLVFANMDAPWSAFICGSQGAGKSHTLSCLLENALLADSGFNELPNPLSGLVFHYDKFTGSSTTQLCEAAFLCSAGIPVTVLVSPSNIWSMKDLYTNLPGLPFDSPRPKVLPMYISPDKLTTGTIMKLMCADASGKVPLYISVVHGILQEMAMQGNTVGRFSYNDFKKRIDDYHWVGGQKAPLEMRLKLLEMFLTPSELTRTARPAPATEDIWAFDQGSLTIIDLSDPFVDENDACALFSICLSVFMESRGTCGQIIALDEAHKFLTQSGEAKALTEDLTSIMRQQRHTGTRVVIATQEPTLSPKLMDLANVTIVHRFLSPAWYETIRRHIAGANKYDGNRNNTLFDSIVTLKTGEALLFCPTALLTVQQTRAGKAVTRLANDYARIRIRHRKTADGGKSVTASEVASSSSIRISTNVPMHVVTRPPSPPPQPRYDAAYNGEQQSGQGSNGHRAINVARNSPLAQMQTATSEYIQTRFAHGWTSYDSISWSSTFKRVEQLLHLKYGTIEKSTVYMDTCHDAAFTQINKCREQHGMSIQKY